MKISKNLPPTSIEFDEFISNLDFKISQGYLKFMKVSNGANIDFDNRYVELWPITDLFYLNQEYEVGKFASDFFLIGSDGCGMSFGIKKSNGKIYEIPFIGMNNEDAIFISDDFDSFLSELRKKNDD